MSGSSVDSSAHFGRYVIIYEQSGTYDGKKNPPGRGIVNSRMSVTAFAIRHYEGFGATDLLPVPNDLRNTLEVSFSRLSLAAGR